MTWWFGKDLPSIRLGLCAFAVSFVICSLTSGSNAPLWTSLDLSRIRGGTTANCAVLQPTEECPVIEGTTCSGSTNCSTMFHTCNNSQVHIQLATDYEPGYTDGLESGGLNIGYIQTSCEKTVICNTTCELKGSDYVCTFSSQQLGSPIYDYSVTGTCPAQ